MPGEKGSPISADVENTILGDLKDTIEVDIKRRAGATKPRRVTEAQALVKTPAARQLHIYDPL